MRTRADICAAGARVHVRNIEVQAQFMGAGHGHAHRHRRRVHAGANALVSTRVQQSCASVRARCGRDKP
eukprot:11396567-Alexandrium_andersonii.AAC.1